MDCGLLVAEMGQKWARNAMQESSNGKVVDAKVVGAKLVHKH